MTLNLRGNSRLIDTIFVSIPPIILEGYADPARLVGDHLQVVVKSSQSALKVIVMGPLDWVPFPWNPI